MTEPLITEQRGADVVLLGVPMYDFGVPATLEAWVDRIGFPGAFIDTDTGESVLRDTNRDRGARARWRVWSGLAARRL